MVEVLNQAIANPSVVLREEFDDWALLFNPDTGEVYGLNPTGVFIWKLLDGKHSIENILDELKSDCENIPANVIDQVSNFIEDLAKHGLVGSLA